MPVTLGSFRSRAYQVGAMQVPAAVAHPAPGGHVGPVRYRNEHTMYPTASARVTVRAQPPTAQNKLTVLSGVAAGAGGNAVFLKFFNDHITSVRLPAPAAAAGLFFVTDNMSGCKLYVDAIAGSNDLIVYHANTLAHSAGLIADADVQTPAAAGVLDAMHTAAQGDYLAHHGLVLNNIATCAMPRYFASGGDAERRKRLQGRMNSGHNPPPGAGPKFMGGCTIAGFRAGGAWQFWYQTWGDVGYIRPDIGNWQAFKTLHWNYLRKKATEGLRHTASYATMALLEARQI